jgi:Aldo/keto reductase family
MDKRTLGTNGPEVSAIGLGCMSMTGGYSDKPDRQEMISLIRTAVDRGVTFFDTAEIYGPYANEELVGEALAPYQGQVVIATKFGCDIDPVEHKPRGRVTSRPEVIKHVVDGSLQPARRRRHRPLLPAPGRPTGAHRRRRRRGQGPHRSRQGQALRPVRGCRTNHLSGARGATRRPSRANTRCGGGVPRKRCWPPVRNSASASCPQPARQGLSQRHHHGVDHIRCQQRHPQHHPPVHPGRAPAQPGRCRPAREHRPTQGHHTRPDRAGLAVGREALDRSDPRHALHRLEENIRAADVELSADELTDIENAASKIQVQGGRYNEAAERMTNL